MLKREHGKLKKAGKMKRGTTSPQTAMKLQPGGQTLVRSTCRSRPWFRVQDAGQGVGHEHGHSRRIHGVGRLSQVILKYLHRPIILC